MQTDVYSGHLNSSGFVATYRTRLKGLMYTSSSTAGTINMWDVTAAPTAAATGYTQSGTTVTVVSAAHGLNTGDRIGITFATNAGVSATNGNYVVTVTNSSTFTITDINSRTIASATACTFTAANGRWLMSIDTAALTTSGVPQNQTMLIPGEGLLALNGIYGQLSNQTGLTIFYG
jgi:hypothetical protein